MRLADFEDRPLHQVEMDMFDVTHAEIGGYLLGLWTLPSRIVEAVALHHTPNEMLYAGLCALTTVHVADALLRQNSNSAQQDEEERLTAGIDVDYLQRTGLTHRLSRWSQLAAGLLEQSEAGVS